MRKVFIISLAAAAAAQTSSKKCTDDCLTCPTTCPCKYETQKHRVNDKKDHIQVSVVMS